ncbi:MAG: DUF5103 domain-containing protein [Sphingobacteriales bacterium]|jgi:hypothetical protein|nr:MAG: DUF5103 domain-containing protein [Sphingobacteriales bacterium]
MSKFIISYILLLFSVCVYGKVYETQTNDPTLKTVQLYPKNKPLDLPIMGLNGSGTLELHFDDLAQTNRTYYYTVIQCHTDWTPTILNQMEYIDGFIESTIYDYDFSAGVKQKYTHYRLEIPNQDMTITKSGNYVLVVYENSMQEPLFTHRFMVAENRVGVNANVAYARNLYDRNKFQDITFTINYKGYTIFNPQVEIRATVLQNNRWDNAVQNVPPYLVGLNTISYDYMNTFLFPSGREFRQFDTRSLRFKGQNIRVLDVNRDYNQVYLLYDLPLMNQSYNFFQDMNGGYYIENFDLNNYMTQVDYTWVQFNIDYKKPIPNGKLYVVGAFNQWKCDENSELEYIEDEQAYVANIYMKQGLYNYAYVFVDDQGKKHYDITEGYYADTENNYTILIYHTPFGERYDRIIAIKNINSLTDR